MIVPAFPDLVEPGLWDELTLLSATVFLEAAGEPDLGKEAIVHVIMNRVERWHLPSIHNAILGRDLRAYDDARPFEQFSCWNDNEKTRAVQRLAASTSETTWRSWRAAAIGRWRLRPDPTNGATYYLNLDLTKKIRGGALPEWAARLLVVGQVTTIAQHTFLTEPGALA